MSEIMKTIHVEDDPEAERLRCVPMTPKRQVYLPEDLCAIVEKRFSGRFGNFEAFLEFVLRELVCDDAQALDESERAMIEKRLRDLGYL
jgi:hypothetical protein